MLFGNSLGSTAREIALQALNAETKGNVEKAHILARGKYLATAFLLSSDRRRYGEPILLLKNDYTKQQGNYLRILTAMYGIMVTFDPTRATSVGGGRNEGLNFGNVVSEYKFRGDRDHCSGGSTGRKLE